MVTMRGIVTFVVYAAAAVLLLGMTVYAVTGLWQQPKQESLEIQVVLELEAK